MTPQRFSSVSIHAIHRPPAPWRRRRTAPLVVALLATAAMSLAGRAAPVQDAPPPADHAATPLSDVEPAAASAPLPAAEVAGGTEGAAHLSRAEALAADRDFAEALDALRSAASSIEGDAYEIAALRAACERALGREDDAIRSAELALRLRPDSPATTVLLGELLAARGRLDESAARLRRVANGAGGADLDPHVTVAWLRLGEALEQRGYAHAAAEAYDVFDRRVFDTHREHRNFPAVAELLSAEPLGKLAARVRLYLAAGAADEAQRVAAAGAAMWPDSLVVTRLHAEALVAQEEYQKAFALCASRLDQDGGMALWPVALRAARGAERVDALVEQIGPRLEAAPPGDAAFAFIDDLLRAGPPRAAAAVCARIVAAHGDRPDLATRHAAALYALEGIDAATARLAAFAEQDASGRGLSIEAVAEFAAPEAVAAAVRAAVDAAAAAPAAEFARDYVLAVLAAQVGRTEQAATLADRAAAARPDYAPARLVLIHQAAARHAWDRVIAEASGILLRDRGVAAAWFALGGAYDALDEVSWAEECYKKALDAAPDVARYATALGELHRRNQDLLAAQRYFQQALILDPASAEAFEGLIDSYVLGGKLELALATYDAQDLSVLPPDARRRADVAARYIRTRDAEGYLADLRALCAAQPRDAVAGRLLAARLLAGDRLDEAAEAASRVLELAPDDAHMRVVRARIAARRAEFGEAAAQLQRVRERFPRRADLLRTLAQYLMYDFQLEASRAALRDVIDPAPAPAPDPALGLRQRPRGEEEFGADHVALLDSYARFGEFDRALALLDEWAPRFGDREIFEEVRLSVLIAADRKEEAVRILDERLDARPDDRTRREQFVRACLDLKAYEPLVERFRAWLDESPENFALAMQLAAALTETGKADEAVELARAWHKDFEDDADRTEALIDTLNAAKRFDDALKVARDFEGTLAEAARRRIWLGDCHAAAGKHDAAIAEYEALLAERWLEEHVRLGVRQRLVRVWLDAEMFDRGLARCAEWLAEAGDRLELQIEFWSYQRILGQQSERRAEYESAMERLLAVGPNDPGLNNDLGYTWVDRGANVDRATRMIRSAVAAEPLNAAFLDSLGWAYYLSGRFAEAREQLRRATLLPEGRDPVVYDHLGDAALRIGDREAAIAAWRSAVDVQNTMPEERKRPEDAAVIEAARRKLQALQSGTAPDLARTAAERNGR